MQQGNYQNAGSFQNYPQDQYIRPQGGSMAQPGDFNQPYSPRSHYPPYVADNERYSYVLNKKNIVTRSIRRLAPLNRTRLPGHNIHFYSDL